MEEGVVREVKCPEEYNGESRSVFVAGGISGCSDWQSLVVEKVKDLDCVLINPRRGDFDVSDLELEKKQIDWEYRHLKKADAIMFWFPRETLCPITLFELGKIAMTDKPLFVGVHPNYKRKRDVIIQLSLIRPDVCVVESIDELVEGVRRWGKKK